MAMTPSHARHPVTRFVIQSAQVVKLKRQLGKTSFSWTVVERIRKIKKTVSPLLTIGINNT